MTKNTFEFIIIAVLNTIASLRFTINSDTAAYWQQDITVNFKEPYRRQLVEEEGLRIPGVTRVEGWSTQTGFRTYADGRESREDIALFGAPVDSAFIRPTLLAERWLRPDDTQALVANVYLYEGSAVGLLSWLLGVLGSIPLSLLMNYALGRSLAQQLPPVWAAPLAALSGDHCAVGKLLPGPQRRPAQCTRDFSV